MASKLGPRIVTDNLVLALDCADAKSYAGEPVTNLYGDMSTSVALRPNRTEYNTGGTWPTDMPMCPEPVGRVYKHTSGALTSSWSGDSYGYSYKDIATTSGETYICTCWVFISAGSDIDYMYLGIEGYLSGAGIPSGYTQVYNLNNKGTWQQLALYVIADTNVRFLPVYPRHSGVTDGSFSGFYAWGGAQVVKANYVTPFVLSSRSATDGWVDLSGNSNDGTLVNDVATGTSHYRSGDVILPNSARYLDFDGSDQYLDLPIINYSTYSGLSVESWFNADALTAHTLMSSWGYVSNSDYCWLLFSGWWDDNKFDFLVSGNGANYSRVQSSTTLSTGTWYHIVGTWDNSGSMKIYINGSLDNSITGATTTLVNTNFKTGIGADYDLSNSGARRFWNGKIGLAKIYDKSLTAAEVLQNYNSTKSRFS